MPKPAEPRCPTCGRPVLPVFDHAELGRQTYFTLDQLASYVYGESSKRMQDPVKAMSEMVRRIGIPKVRWGRRVLVSRLDVERHLRGHTPGQQG